MDLTVVIPAYNEEKSIEEAVRRTVMALRGIGVSFEVVVVDDGSRDRTRAIAEAAATELSEVRVVVNEKNQGAVKAFLRGCSLARGDVVTHNGADLPFDPHDTGVILEEMRKGADVVVVERANREAYGVVRKVVSWVNITVLHTLFGSPFWDHNFVQGYRRDVLRNIDVVTSAVSTVTPELVIKAYRKGYECVGVKCTYHKRELGESTIRVTNVVDSVLQLGGLWWSMRKSPRRPRR
jgi:glycosyltransferase involved in cell wall biosynthesis